MTINRRQLLKHCKNMGISMAAWPLLSSLPSFAQGIGNSTRGNKRLLVIWHPHGMHQPSWTTGVGHRSGEAWQLSRVLEPLQAVKQKMNVVEGVSGIFSGTDERHQRGMVGLLTGADMFNETLSIDQLVADHWQTKALQLSAQCEPRLYNAKYRYENFRISFRGPGEGGAQNGNNNPFSVYRQLFSGSSEDFETRFVTNKSVLDALLVEIDSVKSRLSIDDKHLLDAHQTGIRELECSFHDTFCENDLGGGAGGACVTPNIGDQPSNLDDFLRQNNNYPAICKMQSDIAKVAVGCSLAPVTVLQFAATESTHTYSWVTNEDGQSATSSDHHELSHNIYTNERARKDFNAIHRWYSQQVADIATYLDGIPEGNGTALDNTLIYWGTCLGSPHDHWQYNWPSVLIGGAGGFFRTNQSLDFRKDRNGRCYNDPRFCFLDTLSDTTQVDLLNTMAASMNLPASDGSPVVGNINGDRNAATHVSRAFHGLVRDLMA